jgi:D-glycero-alpha-D-manno-heptose 1-phosphate guanylyltransferase
MNKTLVVLAGGFGTRLHSVLNGLPKPLADINGEPFLKYQFENWIKNGFNDFILSLHYQAELIIEFLEKKRYSLLKNCKIQYIVEPTPFGTGGAIAYLISKLELSDPFFVTNADTWIESGYDQLNLINGCVIGLTEVVNASRYGNVLLDKSGYIINFEEKVEFEKSGLINIGLYKLDKSIFHNLKIDKFSIEKQLFPLLIMDKKISGTNIQTRFIDIGVPVDYYEFCKWKKIN